MASTFAATRGLVSPRASVWVVEDQSLLRESLRELLAETPDLDCPLAVATVEEAIAALGEGATPDLVLMDIGLPGASGIEGAELFAARVPGCRVVILTVHDEDEKVFRAICAGASGYLLKAVPAATLLAGIRDVLAGGAAMSPPIAARVLDRLAGKDRRDAALAYRLTPREQETLELVVDGLPTKAIASRLGCSYGTIDTHIRHIYEKLHVHSRAAAVAKALREEIVARPESRRGDSRGRGD